MTLLCEISKFSSKSTALVWKNNCVSYLELKSKCSKYARALSGKRLLLQTSDPIEFIKTMIAGDGMCKSLTFLPPDLNIEHSLLIAKLDRSDLYIGDNDKEFEVISSIKGLKDLQRITSSNNLLENRSDTLWKILTSGTTGKPKLISHTFKTLTKSVATKSHRNPKNCWGLLFEHYRFAGIQVILQSILTKGILIIPDIKLVINLKIDFLRNNHCTHLSATPTLWRSILMYRKAKELNLKQVTLGGEIADEKLLVMIKVSYPQARITHIYASTEAGVSFSVNDGKPGFPTSYLHSKLNGHKLTVKEGTLYVHNTSVSSINKQIKKCKIYKNTWIDTGDSVKIIENRVYFTGRNCRIINCGGNKINPEEVEQQLLLHPQVQSAVVYGRRSSLMGSIVAAKIVISEFIENEKELKNILKMYLSEKFEKYKIPSLISIEKNLEISSSGKIIRSV